MEMVFRELIVQTRETQNSLMEIAATHSRETLSNPGVAGSNSGGDIKLFKKPQGFPGFSPLPPQTVIFILFAYVCRSQTGIINIQFSTVSGKNRTFGVELCRSAGFLIGA
ncbi:MAG: hypothetical protein C7B44_10010 [Sulfobacillus thermosulfidooxidans]|nr:MAG: hypothetical protein C7B44_10010 [Sulfobacillus thermosulfidooxidans]